MEQICSYFFEEYYSNSLSTISIWGQNERLRHERHCMLLLREKRGGLSLTSVSVTVTEVLPDSPPIWPTMSLAWMISTYWSRISLSMLGRAVRTMPEENTAGQYWYAKKMYLNLKTPNNQPPRKFILVKCLKMMVLLHNPIMGLYLVELIWVDPTILQIICQF